MSPSRKEKMIWPCNSSELTRRMGLTTEAGESYVFFVRGHLRDLDCPKTGRSQQAHYIVDEERGREAARRMGRTLR